MAKKKKKGPLRDFPKSPALTGKLLWTTANDLHHQYSPVECWACILPSL